MRVSTWTILLALITLVINTASKSISNWDTNSHPVVTPSIEALRKKIRNTVTSYPTIYNSLSKLNVTVEEKRRKLRQYRAKLQELSELDTSMDYQEPIHRRVIYKYKCSEGAKVGHYTFPVKVLQPKDYTKEMKVQSATVKLYRQNNLPQLVEQDLASDSIPSSQRNVGYNSVLLVYQILPGGFRRLVTSKVISLARSDWISIDITEIAQSWVDEPGMNQGIEIESTTHNISQILTPKSEHLHLPTLNIAVYEKSIGVKRRMRRDAESEEDCIPGGCCRQQIRVLAEDIGLPDHHVNGEYITAYTCTGGCPNRHKLHTFWAHAKDNLGLENRCAPVAYQKTYDHIYLDQETGAWVVTEYDDLIVTKCGCV